MKTYKLITTSSCLVLSAILSISCHAQQKTESTKPQSTISTVEKANNESAQIGAYVVTVFEDSKGNLWFATLDKGVAMYDGEVLKYYTTDDGLCNNSVVCVIEDNDDNLWFGTQSGLSRYDGKSFTNYTVKDGLCHNSVSNLFIDSKDNFWIGTWGGVCRFDKNTFINFPIPKPLIETQLNEYTKNWITEIMQDKAGNIWFGRDGYGACKYDGKTFMHFTKKDGLNSNNVIAIVEDQSGNIWLGTRVAEKDNPDAAKRSGAGGLNKYDGHGFTSYPEIEGLSKNDVYTIYCDDEGNVWVSTIEKGVYKYDGRTFTNYIISSSGNMPSKAIQSIMKDRNGNMWFGCSGGLFKLNSNGIVNMTTDVPWH